VLILVGGFNYLEKYESQWEGLSHILWKIKFMFETTNQLFHHGDLQVSNQQQVRVAKQRVARTPPCRNRRTSGASTQLR